MAREVSITVSQRAFCAAAGIIPLTVAGGALLICGCRTAAWVIEIVTAAAYFTWIMAARGKR